MRQGQQRLCEKAEHFFTLKKLQELAFLEYHCENSDIVRFHKT